MGNVGLFSSSLPTDANLVLGRILPQFFPHIFGPQENEPLDAEGARWAARQVGCNCSCQLKMQRLLERRGRVGTLGATCTSCLPTQQSVYVAPSPAQHSPQPSMAQLVLQGCHGGGGSGGERARSGGGAASQGRG